MWWEGDGEDQWEGDGKERWEGDGEERCAGGEEEGQAGDGVELERRRNLQSLKLKEKWCVHIKMHSNAVASPQLWGSKSWTTTATRKRCVPSGKG